MLKRPEFIFDQLKAIRSQLGRDDTADLEISKYPLREIALGHRSTAWANDTYLALFIFQCAYSGHRTRMMMARDDTVFESFVTEHAVTINEDTRSEQVIDGLKSYAKALRDYAAKLVAVFEASVTMS